MVGFGKSIVKARRQQWASAYIDYERLKRIVENIERAVATSSLSSSDDESTSLLPTSSQQEDRFEVIPPAANATTSSTTTTTDEYDLESLRRQFFKVLGTEIEKISLFTLHRQGKLAETIGALRFESLEDNVFSKSDWLLKDMTFGNTLDQYSTVGVEMLHLLKFICVNSIGVRKILKKYNKVFERIDEPHSYYLDGNHLQQLAFSRSMSAIQFSLEMELARFYTEMQEGITMQEKRNKDPENPIVLSFYRFQCIVDCVHSIQRYAEILQRPFWNFLAQSSMIRTAINFGDMDRAGKDSLLWLLRLKPDKLLTMTEGELQHMWNRWATGPNTTRALKDNTPRMPRQALATILEENDAGSVLTSSEDQAELYWGGVDWVSMALNLTSKLLYTVNYYIIAPTANHYAIKLGLDGAFGASLIGASSFSAFFAAFFFSFWYKKSTFKSALLFSALCPLIGNLMYALAISFDSMGIAMAGRILVGFGSAEVVNRQLISACVDFEGMTKASALFVTADAIGMSIGPLIAGILDKFSGRDMDIDLELPFLPNGGIIYDHITSPGFVMSVLWFLQLAFLLFLFREPERLNESDKLSNEGENVDDSAIFNNDDPWNSEDSRLEKKIEYGSFSSSYEPDSENIQHDSLVADMRMTVKLIFKNVGLPLTILFFGYIEMTCEVLISSCSMVVRRYFGWHGSVAGFLIASLGALVIPAHFVVEKACHHFSERKILVQSLIVVLFGFLGIFNWTGLYWDIAGVTTAELSSKGGMKAATIGNATIGNLLTDKNEFPYDYGAGPAVYIGFLSVIFIGTIVMESVDTSIMAKATPAKLNRCFVNTGLLATLVGTVGRVFADFIITLSALLDRHIFVDFVNATFAPLILLALLGLLLINRFYERLVN